MSTTTVHATLRLVPAGCRPPGVRLTRRGRVALFATLLVLAFLALVWWGPAGVATPDPGDPVATHTVTVQPGDTLWDIAARADPGGNTGETVQQIAELNALPSTGQLQIGQRLAVPAY